MKPFVHPAGERLRLRYMLDEAEFARDAGRSGPLGAPRPSGFEARTRIAVLATPRSGNTWTRLMLGHVLDLVELPVHHPADLDWSSLPDRAVIQLHWPRSPYLQSLLDRAGVTVVTPVRHPFDVLISVLRFAQIEPGTGEWLWGQAGDEGLLLDADPTSTQFAQWALSDRAAALLDLSRSWAAGGRAVTVRYEDLIAFPQKEFSSLLETLGVEAARPTIEAVERFTPEWINRTHGFKHAGQALAGDWEELMSSDLVDLLLTRYGSHLETLGYSAHRGRAPNRDEIIRLWASQEPTVAPLSEDAYQAALQIMDAGTSDAPKASQLTLMLKVENRGSARWPVEQRHPRIRLGYRWYRSGEARPTLEGRSLIERELQPGNATYQAVTIPTPSEPASYQLRVELVHEHVRWFGRSVEVSITVT